jgi:ribosomal protein S18 acetylase RimI-like enzyme
MSITLREATPDDEEFLLKVYSSTREDELAAVPWSAEQRDVFMKMQFGAQHSYYHEYFPEAEYQVVLVDGAPVGRLYVQWEKGDIHILDIALLPEVRRRGIATQVLNALMGEAANDSKRLWIYVESFNPALGLFDRLGFKRTAEEGINFLMEYEPA